MGNIVAIVGRPNVGKSTLFNRLTESRQSIMDNTSGVTRDRLYGHAEWTGKNFTVIDTGGYVVGSEDIFEGAIREQVELALSEANVVLFMVDAVAGLTDLDKDFARVVRKFNKPTYLVANKIDEPNKIILIHEFHELGMGDIHPVSSINGSGTGDLLDLVVSHFEKDGIEDPYAGIPKMAILGRPNVGKSSFLNTLIGQDRSIVTDIAGTTRDAINTLYKAYGKEILLIDTAGIRKKSKVKDNIEFYSVLRSIRALEEADVCIVMLDAERGLESQDVNIISLSNRNGKGLVIMVNKWDLVEKDSKTAKAFQDDILARIAPINYPPIIFTSVINKQRIFQVLEKAMHVYENLTRKIPTSALNDVMLKEIENYPPPAWKGKYIKIKYITQLPARSPTFVFFCNLPQYIRETYIRYLENQMRKNFDFEGAPIRLFFRKK